MCKDEIVALLEAQKSLLLAENRMLRADLKGLAKVILCEGTREDVLDLLRDNESCPFNVNGRCSAEGGECVEVQAMKRIFSTAEKYLHSVGEE